MNWISWCRGKHWCNYNLCCFFAECYSTEMEGQKNVDSEDDWVDVPRAPVGSTPIDGMLTVFTYCKYWMANSWNSVGPLSTLHLWSFLAYYISFKYLDFRLQIVPKSFSSYNVKTYDSNHMWTKMTGEKEDIKIVLLPASTLLSELGDTKAHINTKLQEGALMLDYTCILLSRLGSILKVR